jgi:hypothetical protein
MNNKPTVATESANPSTQHLTDQILNALFTANPAVLCRAAIKEGKPGLAKQIP